MSNIHDNITNANGALVARTAFATLDRLQDYQPAEQVLGAGLLFLLWCKRYNVDPKEVLGTAAYIFRDGLLKHNEHIGALRHFMKVDVVDPYSFSF